jgi:predicted transcriptional regulator
MKIVWQLEHATVRQVHSLVFPDTGWAYSTVKTMLDRLHEKGFLNLERIGPVKRYSPAVPKAQFLPKAVASFLDQVLDDSLAPLVTYIARSRDLDPEDIQELKRILQPQNASEKEADS